MCNKLSYLDPASEVKSFIKGHYKLRKLPFISESDMKILFSTDLLNTLDKLTQVNNAAEICANCSDRCCALIHCELYDPVFGRCPIFNWRPLLCRFHFCHKFEEYREDVKNIGDIFLECLLEAEKLHSNKAPLFDSPPLSPAAPFLFEEVMPLMTGFRGGRLNSASAMLSIQKLVESYQAEI